jgi:hypothetical protein
MEGDVETGPGVYDIPLWVMLPKEQEASNLLVCAAPSASHIGMSTLRLEPQFMIIGQSAGVVAARCSLWDRIILLEDAVGSHTSFWWGEASIRVMSPVQWQSSWLMLLWVEASIRVIRLHAARV